MGKRTLSNARTRVRARSARRLDVLEREVRALKQRLGIELELRLHEIQKANFSAMARVSAELSRSAMSAVNFSAASSSSPPPRRDRKQDLWRRIDTSVLLAVFSIAVIGGAIAWVVLSHVD